MQTLCLSCLFKLPVGGGGGRAGEGSIQGGAAGKLKNCTERMHTQAIAPNKGKHQHSRLYRESGKGSKLREAETTYRGIHIQRPRQDTSADSKHPLECKCCHKAADHVD